MTVVAALLGLALLLALSFMVMYNRFVRPRTLVDGSWGQTDVELTRRHDLIPNLVATVQGYAEHERSVLEALAQAREQAQAHKDEDPKAREGYEEQVDGPWPRCWPGPRPTPTSRRARTSSRCRPS